MKFRSGLSLIACSLFLVSCAAQDAVPVVSPAVVVPSSMASKLPGKYYLTVETEGLVTVARVGDVNCAAYVFPIDAAGPFEESAFQTLQQVVEQVELRDTAVTPDVLQRESATAQIVLSVEKFEPSILFIPGWVRGKPETKIYLSASVKAEGVSGTLLDTALEATRQARRAEEGGCSVGSDVLAQATANTIREVMERLAETVGNSPSMRSLGQ